MLWFLFVGWECSDSFSTDITGILIYKYLVAFSKQKTSLEKDCLLSKAGKCFWRHIDWHFTTSMSYCGWYWCIDIFSWGDYKSHVSNARFAVTSPKAEKLGSLPRLLIGCNQFPQVQLWKQMIFVCQLQIPFQIHILMKVLWLRNRFTTSLGCNQFPVTPKVLLEDHWSMMTIPSIHPIQSVFCLCQLSCCQEGTTFMATA